MKQSIRSLCTVVGIVAALATPSLFATDSVDEVIDTLHEAAKSTEPVPLLQKALQQLEKYNPKTGVGHFRANNAATREHKVEAKHRIEQAIEAATAGKSANEKITAAISEIRLTGQFKH
ncbi:MAG: hypothetical protein ABJF10_15675 [Chthoniobacter sp.]|uniref:hypothetical protein n=1 Tax=Chthoniobacter sp. TaxID=2510640 RepID=UPI0032A4874E